MTRTINIELDDALYDALAKGGDPTAEADDTRAEKTIHKLIGKAAASELLRFRSRMAVHQVRQEIEGKVVSVSAHPLPPPAPAEPADIPGQMTLDDIPPAEVTGIDPEKPAGEPAEEEPEKKNAGEPFPENVPFENLRRNIVETLDDGPVLGYAPRVP